jgi:hypothetical protein
VQLIDGGELRMMLGPVREPMVAFGSIRIGGEGTGAAIARRVGERLLSAAEDRIRYGGRERMGRAASRSLGSIIALKLIAFALLLAFMLLLYKLLAGTLTQILAPKPPHVAAVPAAPTSDSALPATQPQHNPCHEVIDARSGTYANHCAAEQARPVSAEEARKQYRAEEAMKVIAESTPEM